MLKLPGEPDLATRCPRNFLHRYRLAFFDSDGSAQDTVKARLKQKLVMPLLRTFLHTDFMHATCKCAHTRTNTHTRVICSCIFNRVHSQIQLRQSHRLTINRVLWHSDLSPSFSTGASWGCALHTRPEAIGYETLVTISIGGLADGATTSPAPLMHHSQPVQRRFCQVFATRPRKRFLET